MRTIGIILLVLAAGVTTSAETLVCELWAASDVPHDYGAAEFTEERAKYLKAEVRLEKTQPVIGDLRGLLWKAGQKSGMNREDYAYMTRATVFRKNPSGHVTVIVDGKDASSVPLSSVYGADIIIFHEFSVR